MTIQTETPVRVPDRPIGDLKIRLSAAESRRDRLMQQAKNKAIAEMVKQLVINDKSRQRQYEFHMIHLILKVDSTNPNNVCIEFNGKKVFETHCENIVEYHPGIWENHLEQQYAEFQESNLLTKIEAIESKFG